MASYVKHSVKEVCNSNKEVLEKIFDKAFSERQGTAFSYRPFQLPSYSDNAVDQGMNFKELYPDFKEGDYVYIQCCFDGMYDREMIGPFGSSEDNIEVPYGPELNLSFNTPYYSSCGGTLLWKFLREKTYLKPYNHTAFFGQWYYAIMVGHIYMLAAAKKLQRHDFYEFYTKSIASMCNHRDYAVATHTLFGRDCLYLAGSVNLNRLDPVGTIGMNVAEYYMMSGDESAHYTLEKLANAIKHGVLRYPDGVIRRGETMWTDDMFMSLPFLAKLGVIFNDESYFDDILNQLRGYQKLMYMEDCDIFSHIFFIKHEKANRIPWGRGNGWVLLALSEVLLTIPKTYHGREEILKLFRKFSLGIISFRDDKEKLWHQVINNPESYIETSGSAMFITALARGVKNNWIDSSLSPIIEESWNALCEKCVDSDGNIFGVCRGSNCSMDENYYLNLGTMTNDDHGVGIVLSAGVAVMNMLGE